MSTNYTYPDTLSKVLLSRKEYFKIDKDLNNIGCGEQFYFLPEFYKKNDRFKQLGAALMVDSRIKFLPDSMSHGDFFCSGKHGYLVRKSSAGNFLIRKITYPEAEAIWQAKVEVDGGYLYLMSIHEEGGTIEMDVINKNRELIKMKAKTL